MDFEEVVISVDESFCLKKRSQDWMARARPKASSGIWGLELQGFGFGVWGLGFGVQGLGVVRLLLVGDAWLLLSRMSEKYFCLPSTASRDSKVMFPRHNPNPKPIIP